MPIDETTMAATRSKYTGGALNFFDKNWTPAATPIWASCPLLALLDPNVGHRFEDPFHSPDYHTYTSTDDSGTGTNTYNDTAGGALSVVTAAADNDYHLMSTSKQNWLFADNKPLWWEHKFSLTEANTDDSNWCIGFSDTLTTGFMQDDGAGPPASYDGAVFFKVDGTLAIQFETSNAGDQVTNASIATFVSGQTYRVGMVFNHGDGTTGSITPYLDGVAGTAHAITLAGLAEMHLIFGVTAGDTNAETLINSFTKAVQIV